MQIPQHVTDIIKLGHPQQIAEYLGDKGDKSLRFDGKRYIVSGFQGDEYFESSFSTLSPAIAHYQSVKV
jgi:hypothetical protein